MPYFIHCKKNGTSVVIIIFFLVLNFFPAGPSLAAESLSYSGRLVNTNGSPVTGPVDLKVELSYSNAPSTILCSQDLTNIVLSNGVFHLKLDLNCGANGALADVLNLVPANESAAIRVTDVTHSKVYSFQAIHSVPFASVSGTAKQLMQMGASNNQFLKWNDTIKKWEPGTPSGGTVMSVSGSLPISVASGSSSPVVSISQANSIADGYLSSADWNAFNSKQGSIAAGTTAQYYRGDKTWQTLDTSAVPENVANLYFTNARALGVPLAGFVTGTGAIVATDTALQAFGKAQGQIDAINTAGANYLTKNSTDSITGVVNVGTIGLLQLAYTPVGLNDATNKSYVDAGDNLKVSKSGDIMSGVLTLDSDLKIKGGVNYVTLKGHATTSAYNFILPSSAGTAGYVLSTDGAGNLSWINPGAVTTGTGTVNSASIVDGSIVDADINATAAIAQSKIANLTADLAAKQSTTLANGNILVGSAGNVASAVAISGDATLANTGALTLINTGTAGTYSQVTTDAQGRVISGSNPTVVTAVSVAAPITNTGTAAVPLIGMPSATSLVDGYLKASDWNTFNNKQAALSTGPTINGIIYPANGAQTLQVPLAPVALTDAVNKQYVDSFGQWTTSAGNVYRTSGNVGIGTTGPVAPLDVSGGIRSSGVDGTWGLELKSTTANTTNSAYIVYRDNQATPQKIYQRKEGSQLITYGNDSSYRFAIGTDATTPSYFNGGNVGIGTTSPSRLLNVSGGRSLLQSNAETYSLGIGRTDSAGAYWIGTTSAAAPDLLLSNSAGTEKVRITDAGNVGIGTTTPGQKLTVAGTIESTSGGVKFPDGTTQTTAASAGGPAGSLLTMMTATCPSGYLEANGTAINRTTYATLFAAIGSMYGAGDGTTTFNLPDLRGYFLRGWNHASGNDPDSASRTNRGDGTTGDNVGTKQADQFASHTHTLGGSIQLYGVSGGGSGVLTQISSSSTSATGGNETRPKNINVLYCIKF